MHSTKCPKCGLVYLSTATHCKNCGTETPVPEAPSYLNQTSAIDVAVPMASVAVKGSKIEISRKEKLLYTLKRDSYLFYYSGGVMIVLAFFVNYLLILDGLLNIALGFVAYRFRSRMAAMALLGLAILV